MTKLADLLDGDKVRLSYVYEGTAEIVQSGRATYVRVLDKHGECSSSFDYEEDDYDDLTVEILDRPEPAPKVGDVVPGAVADTLPIAAVVRRNLTLLHTSHGAWVGEYAQSFGRLANYGDGFEIVYLPD